MQRRALFSHLSRLAAVLAWQQVCAHRAQARGQVPPPAAWHAAGFTDIHPAANPTNSTWTNGVSSDGLVSVGRSNIGGNARAFKIVGGTYTQLNNLSGGFGSWATAASSTGSLIVGTSIDFNGAYQAVSWTGTTATTLDNTASFLLSEATGISSTGTTIVGWGFSGTSFQEEAFYHLAGSINSGELWIQQALRGGAQPQQ